MNKSVTKTLLLLLTLSVVGYNAKAQLTVTNNHTAQELVDYLVGPNVAIINPVLNCEGTHAGIFDVVSSNLNLDGGVVLATGEVRTAFGDVGVNGDVSLVMENNNPNSFGDADLTQLSGNPTLDRCILEFDFIPDIDSAALLRFKYVFGSEEYPSFTCTQYNDVFGFFISGPGYNPAVNIALVPGTNIPVAINSINSGFANGDPTLCSNMGAGSPFTQYFVNNLLENGTTVTLDGFTTVLEAQAWVFPCDTYHMKLGIANAWDNGFQSAVFLKKNSFSVDTVRVSLKDVVKSDSGYIAEGCNTASITINRDTTSTLVKTVCFDYSGTATYGVDYGSLPTVVAIPPGTPSATISIIPAQDNVVEPGFETLKIRRLNCCTLTPIDSVELRIYDSLQIKLHNVDTGVCQGTTLNLHVSGAPEFTYMWTPGGSVINPFDTVTTSTPQQTTTYSVTASFLSCPSVTKSFTAVVEPIPQVNIMRDTALCMHDPLILKTDVEPSSFTNYNYLWFTPDNLSDPYVQDPEFWIDDNGQVGKFTYVLAVQTPLGCIGRDTINLTAFPGVTLENVTGNLTVKYGDRVELNAEGAPMYVWLPDQMLDYPNTSNPTVTATDSATFMVIGMNRYGCSDTGYVKMDVDFTMFETLPNAFSPNGDGVNDRFGLGNMKFQRLIEFRVFNRWGQEVFSTTDYKQGWDGSFKGQPQSPGVYQYLIRVTRPDGQQKVLKGDVTLVR